MGLFKMKIYALFFMYCSGMISSEWIIPYRSYAEVVRGIRHVPILNRDTTEEDHYYLDLVNQYRDGQYGIRNDLESIRPRERKVNLCVRVAIIVVRQP